MQIGDPKYKKCPSCGFLNKYYPGPYFVNYYGFHEWSDGYTFQELPSLKKTKLKRCGSCKKFYWHYTMGGNGSLGVDDQVDAIDFYLAKYRNDRFISWIYKKKNIFYLRTLLWREFNHHFRNFPHYTSNNTREEFSYNQEKVYIENIKALIDMVNSGCKMDLIHKVELYRNIGDFENATNLLNTINDPKLMDAKEKMMDAILSKNKNIILLKKPNR